MERILDAALAVVDAEGIAALSMRRLARDLGVDPMSIYHHVPNKAALISGLVRAVFAEMALPRVDDGPWDDRVRSWTRAYRELTRAHPNLVLQIVTDVAAVTEASALVSGPLHEALAAGGLEPELAAVASGALVDYVNGHALGAPPTPTPHDPFEVGLDVMIRGLRSLAAEPERSPR